MIWSLYVIAEEIHSIFVPPYRQVKYEGKVDGTFPVPIKSACRVLNARPQAVVLTSVIQSHLKPYIS
jgi:hypothetical protein